MNLFIGQLLTFISYLVFWISRFEKKKRNILIFDNASRIIAIVAFILLGTYDGIKNTIYVIARNIIGQKINNKKRKIKFTIFFVMLIILIIMYGTNFNSISTICLAICGVLNLYGVIMCNEQGIRIFGMIGSVFYSTFMLTSGNIVGTVCEIICFFVMLISYIYYRRKPV